MRTVFVRCYLGATAHPTARQFFARNLPGDNLGNLLFTYAVERQLSASTATVLAEPTRGRGMDPHWLQENVDHLVIPLANAFRWSFRDRLDALSGTLYGSDVASDQLITIDVLTGQGTAVGPLGFPDVEGLTIESGTGILFGTDGQTLDLITIDPLTGAGTRVGSTLYRVDGLADRFQ